MALQFVPAEQVSLGPKSLHRNRERFQSVYTAGLGTVVPEIATRWDLSCLEEWGAAISEQFSVTWHSALNKVASLSTREGAIDFYSMSLKDSLLSKMAEQHELHIDPTELLQECSVRQDLRNTVPSFQQVFGGCECDELRALESLTGIDYESHLSGEYSKRIEHAFANGTSNLWSKTITSFQPGCFVVVAIVLAVIGIFTQTWLVAVIGGAGVVAIAIKYLLSKRQTKKEAMDFAENVVGTFYDGVVSSLEGAIRDKFLVNMETK
jgi:hypothetical protein